MIIVKLMGGLGNQMFQYATGRRLGHKHNTQLKLDISSFDSYRLRRYGLHHFNIEATIATPEEIRALTAEKVGLSKRIITYVVRIQPKMSLTYILEKKKFHFDPDVLKLPDGIYLEGSWQSEKYFADIHKMIRREFTVKTPQSGKDKDFAEWMALCESVSLHIRRGDYVTNSGTNRIHGTCDLDYYRCCVERLASKMKHPHFFIFSDDPEWVRNNLKLPYPITFVDHNGADKNYEDLRLMSECKHHIIANSSFSWWGAWLNQNPEKIVFAPKRWTKIDRYNFKDLIPEKWIKV